MLTPNQNVKTGGSVMARKIHNYINGCFVGSTKLFFNINPVDDTPIAEVCEASESDVATAVAAARNALDGQWGKMPAAERSAWLNRIANGIEQRFDDFVTAEVLDTGRPIKQARSLDIPRNIANFRFFADLIKTACTECFETATADGSIALNYTIRKPIGVVAAISPWNLPILLFSWKGAPALAMGNAIIAKPSEETPSSAALLAEVAHEIGFPAGVFNVVHGFGANSVSRAHNIAQRLHTGIVWIKTWFLRDLRTPFGGARLSGIGHEGGRSSMDFYSETTNVCVKL